MDGSFSTDDVDTEIAAGPGVGDAEGLRRLLRQIREQGWGSAAGAEVLAYARQHVVRPAVRRSGARGPAADQAEATGWEVAWELLRTPSLMSARSPWGVVSAAVRRAVLGEVLANAYGTSAREAWRIEAVARSGGSSRVTTGPPVSLCALLSRGWEPAAPPRAPALGQHGTAVVEAMSRNGWRPETAAILVEAIADGVRGTDRQRGVPCVRDVGGQRGAPGQRSVAGELSAPGEGGSPGGRRDDRPVSWTPATVPAWRRISIALGLPAWQVRRVVVLLLGAPGWPGLLERLIRNGEDVLDTPDVVLAIRSTRSSWLPPPASAARRLATADSHLR